MPSGPPELHEKWGDDLTAMDFLKKRGLRLLRSYQWVLPEGRETPDEEELSAISYLFLEWDFDPCWLTFEQGDRPERSHE